jgi:hypothetical protein
MFFLTLLHMRTPEEEGDQSGQSSLHLDLAEIEVVGGPNNNSLR